MGTLVSNVPQSYVSSRHFWWLGGNEDRIFTLEKCQSWVKGWRGGGVEQRRYTFPRTLRCWVQTNKVLAAKGSWNKDTRYWLRSDSSSGTYVYNNGKDIWGYWTTYLLHNPHNHPMRELLVLYPFYRRGGRNTERLSEMPKILQLISVKPGFETRPYDSRVCTLIHYIIKSNATAEHAEAQSRTKAMVRN